MNSTAFDRHPSITTTRILNTTAPDTCRRSWRPLSPESKCARQQCYLKANIQILQHYRRSQAHSVCGLLVFFQLPAHTECITAAKGLQVAPYSRYSRNTGLLLLRTWGRTVSAETGHWKGSMICKHSGSTRKAAGLPGANAQGEINVETQRSKNECAMRT
jgi:hypothetical protein